MRYTLGAPVRYQSPDEVLEHSRRLCDEARVAVYWAREIQAESGRIREECQCWRELWRVYRRGGYVLMRCAYCGRVRVQSGEWIAVPGDVGEQLCRIPSAVLSHGYCEDCIRLHFPTHGGTA
jgi:hypothetical protein